MKTSPIRISIGPLVIVLLFAAIAVNTAAPLHLEAAPIPIAPGSSISDRVRAQRDLCEIGGGSLGTATTYSSVFKNVVTSVSTVCSGGTGDGWTCTNTPSATDCKQIRVAPTESVVPEQRPDTAEQVENPEGTSPIIGEIVAPPGGVAEDPTGGDQETIARQAVADQVGACETFGGTATVTDNRLTGTIDVRCEGGMMDGMSCTNGHYDTFCTSYRSPTDPEQDAQVPPTGGIEDPTGTTTGEFTYVRVETAAELEDALLAEDPTGSETMVIYNQSGSTVSDNATGQVLLCREAGGTATVDVSRTVGSGLTWAGVFCKGGLLDGAWCINGTGYTVCFPPRRAVTPEDPQVTPVGGIEAPADVPTQTPTVAPTVVSVVPTAPPPTPSPTVVPTIELVEATAVPTKTLPDPKNDNAAPPGNEAEDPTENEPAPTEAPLR